jgi:hypothetical protein
MRNFWLTVLVVLAAGAVSFGAFYLMNDDPAVRQAAHERDAMAWLRAEFHLTDAQFAAIKRLHEGYGTECARHCAMIASARRRQAPAVEVAALEQVCVDSMTAHFRRVAALMPPGEGARYLALVLPRVQGYAHAGAPNLQVQP